ncbi:hypothetical protein Y032_0064g3480 [Ancylostoma ceylanicum]|uniref:Uncharacterized protein n=1 Tax=Ancylostoma ceylanicum TaxID=53326 RepID=A0A016U127_9BILA|nr:hypothetical protein Y032_0064g3480 [Ancylostoma ceylanicum]
MQSPRRLRNTHTFVRSAENSSHRPGRRQLVQADRRGLGYDRGGSRTGGESPNGAGGRLGFHRSRFYAAAAHSLTDSPRTTAGVLCT